MPSDLTRLDGAALHDGVVARKYTCIEIVDAYLEAISARDGELGCFLFVDSDHVRASARLLDEQIASGAIPPLAGYVLAMKDNIAVAGMPMTAGSKILEGYHPPYEATLVTRLRAAGALIIGKTNLDEFAMGASTEYSAYHPTKNPHDPSRVPGGSSGGSAAAVAAGFCTAALGTDTGGSVRQPAAFCGVVGMRPTYGLVSRNGLVALSSSTDIAGPITRTVGDARALLAVMSGHDHADATSLPEASVRAAATAIDVKTLRVGIPKEYVDAVQDGTVRHAYETHVQRIRKQGATIVECSLPMTTYAVPAYYVVIPAEASSNLARFDGVRFGPPGSPDHGHRSVYAHLRDERFGREPKRRIMVGTFTLSAGYADRYYHAAQRTRTLIREDFERVFSDVDVLLTPTTPTPAFPFGAVTDPIDMYRQDIFMSAASLAGIPAISLPLPVDGLPIGVQYIGPQASDDRLLNVAAAVAQLA